MALSMVNTAAIMAVEGDRMGCPRCGGKVFEAEKMAGGGRGAQVYHKRCFTCMECSRGLDSSSVTSGPDNHIYCGNCYIKL